jgi:16S rRNA (guanine527-N7)-methyltransferase
MFKELLAAEFRACGALSDAQLGQLEAHYQSLSRWNERLNLTRITTLTESIQFHYCECLFLAKFLPPGPLRIVDVGSGAGFPGIPVAILRADCEVTLVESHQRKSVFLREASRRLRNIAVLSKRAEDVKGEFDWMVSRAVTPSCVLSLELASSLALLIGGEDASKLTRASQFPGVTSDSCST